MGIKYFSEAELQSLHQAVQLAEQKTGVEMVPVVIAKSASYLSFHLVFALLGWVLTTAALLVLRRDFGLGEFVLWQMAGFALGFLLSEFSWVLRLCVPPSILRREVRKEASAHFVDLSHGHHHGDHRKVLIFISLLERKVKILAEEKTRSTAEQEFLRAQAVALAAGMAQGRAAEALHAAIAACAEYFAKNGE